MEPTKPVSVNFSDFSTSRILKSLSTSKVSTSPETILVDSKLFADRFRRRKGIARERGIFPLRTSNYPQWVNQANLEGCPALLRLRLGSRERENRCLPRSGVQVQPPGMQIRTISFIEGSPQLLLQSPLNTDEISKW